MAEPVLSNGSGGVHGGGRNNGNDDDGSEDEFLFLNSILESLDKYFSGSLSLKTNYNN